MYRSCHDAVANLFQILCRKNSPIFILEADIKGCFDNISHKWITENIPLNKRILTAWLKSGFIEKQKLFPTNAGTPQGGIISPVLANMTLDGLQKHIYQAVGIKFSPNKRTLNNKHQIHLVRYADDFIVTANNSEILKSKIIPAIVEFLIIRGLQLSTEKTVITNINKGFNFLGFNFRKYNQKLLIKPSKQSIKSVKSKIADITKKLSSAKTDEYITTINSVLRGWGYYFRTVVSKVTFSKIDSFVFNRIVRWCKRKHPRKQWNWIKQKYFKTIDKSNWVFYGEKQNIFKLTKIQIRRHIKIVGNANPFIDLHYFNERKLCKTYASCANKI
jgi:RNA-directed DNA polymerase